MDGVGYLNWSDWRCLFEFYVINFFHVWDC